MFQSIRSPLAGKKFTHMCQRIASYYSEPAVPLESIISQFKTYEGGQIVLQKDESSGIATILIDNPAKRNAISGKMMVDLHYIVQELENWEKGKGVIVHSACDFFCSGGDLNTVKQISNPDDGFRMATLMHNSLERLHNLPMVSVALVNGKALGGGAELATVCDFRLFTPEAELSFVQARMGVATGWGGGTRLVQLVGQKTALDLLLTCEKVGAQRALELGLADGIVGKEKKDEPLLDQVKSWLQLRTAHDPLVVRSLKAITSAARSLPGHESLEEERRYFAPLWGGEANKRALEQNLKHK